jgi:TonB family protein
MKRGKKICKTLKEIRLQVARANDIPYEPTECKHKGDCLGTCPKCEQEVRYIEQQLDMRRMLGKAVKVAGVSVGIAALAACHTHKNVQTDNNMLQGDVVAHEPDEQRPQLMGIPPAPIIAPDTLQDNCSEPKSMVVQTDTISENVIFGDVPEQTASFPGGMQKLQEFINENIQYTEEMNETCAQGRVIVQFVIEKDGTVTNPKVVRSIDPLFDKEALRIVSIMPKWIPARRNGNVIRTTYVVPVTFRVK